MLTLTKSSHGRLYAPDDLDMSGSLFNKVNFRPLSDFLVGGSVFGIYVRCGTVEISSYHGM